MTLRFWVRVWRLSCLCGCSSLDVVGPPGSPSDPTEWLEFFVCSFIMHFNIYSTLQFQFQFQFQFNIYSSLVFQDWHKIYAQSFVCLLKCIRQ